MLDFDFPKHIDVCITWQQDEQLSEPAGDKKFCSWFFVYALNIEKTIGRIASSESYIPDQYVWKSN